VGSGVFEQGQDVVTGNDAGGNEIVEGRHGGRGLERGRVIRDEEWREREEEESDEVLEGETERKGWIAARTFHKLLYSASVVVRPKILTFAAPV
jgi:hypothetical protein